MSGRQEAFTLVELALSLTLLSLVLAASLTLIGMLSRKGLKPSATNAGAHPRALRTLRRDLERAESIEVTTHGFRILQPGSLQGTRPELVEYRREPIRGRSYLSRSSEDVTTFAVSRPEVEFVYADVSTFEVIGLDAPGEDDDGGTKRSEFRRLPKRVTLRFETTDPPEGGTYTWTLR